MLFFDSVEFQAYVIDKGDIFRGVEDMTAASNLNEGDTALLYDPLAPFFSNLDKGGNGFPFGLLTNGVSIQSNIYFSAAPVAFPGSGLGAAGPGAINGFQPLDVSVGAANPSQSIDLSFNPDLGITAVGFSVEDPASDGSIEVTVFDSVNEVLAGCSLEIASLQKLYFAFACDVPIGRINVGGGGLELVSDIEMWQAQTVIYCPCDCGSPVNGQVELTDLLAVIGTWGAVGASCDLQLGLPGVGIEEFIAVLGEWGTCEPEPCNFCETCSGGPLSGPCCVATGTPGCNNPDCCLKVCQLLPYCCEEDWDQQCRDQAFETPECGCDT